MTTWDAMDSLSWDEIEWFTWDELERLTIAQVRHAVHSIWPIVRALDVGERELLKADIVDGSIPTGVRFYSIDDPDAPGVDGLWAMNDLWQRLKPQTRGETLAYLGILLAVLQLAVSAPPVEHEPDVTVVIQIMPEDFRIEILPPADPPIVRDV